MKLVWIGQDAVRGGEEEEEENNKQESARSFIGITVTPV